jgi:NAD(P)-dependent dehydrogenase (short-subunit alcohol dehydrogenase family)
VSAVLTSPVTSPFGFDSTAADVVAGIDLRGRRAIVTGAASGIGIETARALAGAGADVTLAVRDADAGARVAADIAATTGATGVHVGRLDLSDQASVAAFVAGWHGPLDVLVNNAGVLLTELQRTAEGWEMHLATNYLGHFALALGLHGALAAAGRACVVSVSSEAHLRARFDFDDPNFTARPYDAMLAYGPSKTANALFAVEASRRWAREGITPNAVHPGAVYETDLKRHLDPDALARALEAGGYELKTPEQGAATSVFVATSPQLEGIGGRYFADCNQAPVVDPAEGAGPRAFGVAAYALDPDDATRLWHLSLDLIRRTR